MHSSKFHFERNKKEYRLIMVDVSLEDSGRYSVTAENSSGLATCSALVIVEELGKTGNSRGETKQSSGE